MVKALFVAGVVSIALTVLSLIVVLVAEVVKNNKADVQKKIRRVRDYIQKGRLGNSQDQKK